VEASARRPSTRTGGRRSPLCGSPVPSLGLTAPRSSHNGRDPHQGQGLGMIDRIHGGQSSDANGNDYESNEPRRHLCAPFLTAPPAPTVRPQPEPKASRRFAKSG
jgi:hypothetical protein